MTEKRKRILLLVLLAVFLFSAGMVIRRQLLYQRLDSERLEAAQIAGLVREDAPSQAPGPAAQTPAPEEPEPLPREAKPLAAVDLEALRAVNGDVVAWIAIPGTELSYPLVQGADNRLYLTHNWKGEPSGGGSVFLEATNDRALTDFHTIVYAHEMRNDSMFGSLKYYKEPDYLREHPSVYLVLDGKICRYGIFSAQKTGVKSIVYRRDLEESGLEEEFLQYCAGNSEISSGLNPAPGDRILSLSTCAGNDRANRWVVSAVLQDSWSVD